MNANIDPDLLKMVQHDVDALKNDVDKLAFEEEVNREKLKKALQDAVTDLEELQKRVAVVEHNVSTTQAQISALQSEQEDVQRRVSCLEDQQNTSKPQINYGNLNKYVRLYLTIVQEEQRVAQAMFSLHLYFAAV